MIRPRKRRGEGRVDSEPDTAPRGERGRGNHDAVGKDASGRWARVRDAGEVEHEKGGQGRWSERG
eukprot:945844-Rhodomonas_salina.2